MKGVILAGGNGMRLRPLTEITNKHLLPVYNQPMILYPLQTLVRLGVTEILIVSGGEHIGAFAEFLGDGSKFGARLTYRIQMKAGGIAEALSLAESFAAGEKVMVILGDNIFENEAIKLPPDAATSNNTIIWGKEVPDPERFGVIVWEGEKVSSIEEKPSMPRGNMAVTGLYVYPADVFDFIKTLTPSSRGELEITDVNNRYVQEGRLTVFPFEGFWSDAGTFESLARSTEWARTRTQS